MTPSQASALSSALRRFSGQKVSLFLHNATPETDSFANALKTAMERAGLTVSVQRGTIFGVVPHGISMKIGEARMDIANVVSDMLINFGVAETPIRAKKASERDVFEIRIAP
ncbi:hypothetical protein MYX77_03635 [Acidobacteriia bacterium AH_259_A11_L15]|nr:hypothetical protein [Acidobacteriia bacterium AH_259_A11_L15]